jgi:predicted nucleic-acid-binding protein
MIGIDTNLLVRLLVKDDEVQAKKVHKIFKLAEKNGEVYFVSTLVILELIWVLESVYKCSREEVIEAIYHLTLMPVLKIDQIDAIHKFIDSANKSNLDISDLLIAHCSAHNGCKEVLTFDKKAAKHQLFKGIV